MYVWIWFMSYHVETCFMSWHNNIQYIVAALLGSQVPGPQSESPGLVLICNCIPFHKDVVHWFISHHLNSCFTHLPPDPDTNQCEHVEHVTTNLDHLTGSSIDQSFVELEITVGHQTFSDHSWFCLSKIYSYQSNCPNVLMTDCNAWMQC